MKAIRQQPVLAKNAKTAKGEAFLTVGRGADPAFKMIHEQPPAHRAGLQNGRNSPVVSARRPYLAAGFAVGRGVDLAARSGAGTPPYRGLPQWAGLFLLFIGLSNANAQIAPPDLLFLRDGRTLSGNIVGETPDVYRTLLPASPSPLLTNVAVQAVRYVVYGSSAKARTALRLDETARSLGANDAAQIRFLPTEAFGEALAEAALSAQSRIWIMAYYISGGGHPVIQNFYSTICAKARAGLDVRVISEFGKGTPMPIRNATLNYAKTLQDDGLWVRFIQEYRTLHKKVILIDRDKVLLGSANLTGVGVSYSDEFSALIVSEPFARQAEADFNRLAQQAQSIEKLDY
ncbi:MAG: phospholipase D family protein [Kiritimatiellia bacterium]